MKKNSSSLEEFFSDLPVTGAVPVEGKKGLSNISPLLYISCKHFLAGATVSLRHRLTSALTVWWVSAEPSSCLPREARGSSGHLHLCFPYCWSAQEENTDSWALNSPNVCNGGADRNELFKNWHEMLPVIFRIHHFILAGICFTVGKYFQSHLPLKNVRYFQKLQ